MPRAKVSAKKSTRSSQKITRESHAENTKASDSTQNSVTTYVRNPRLWVGAAVVVLAVLVYVFKGLFIAATVNGQPIARLSVVSQLEKQNGKQALDNLIVQSLVMQEASKKHITVSQADVDGQIKKIDDQLKTQGVTLADALASRGMTQSDLVEQIKLQEVLNKLVGSSVSVSDADVQSYIDKNKDTLPTDLSDDQLKAQVKSQLQQQALQTKTQTFVSDLQKKASIQYFVNY